MKKPHCKICDQEGHYAYQCFKRKQQPLKQYKRLKQSGKHSYKWQAAKKKWFAENPKSHYTCYICGGVMDKSNTTLDHIIPRSRAPHLRYEMNNLAPCCFTCNSKKGSRVYAEDN